MESGKMDDLISRQAAIDAIDETDWYHQNRNGEMVHGANSAEHQAWYKADDVYNALGSVPSADVQPRKTAEWVYGEKDGADGWYCSECKFHIPWYYDYYGLNNINFIKDFHTCPHCDAKMLKYTGMEREQNA